MEIGENSSWQQEYPDVDCIHFLINNSYHKNPDSSFILQDFNLKIPISEFIIYCVGFINDYRKVQCIRILQKKPSDKITTMKIEWFDPSYNYKDKSLNGVNQPYPNKVTFWVNSGVCLKKFFFLYEDKLNLFRSAFIYYSRMDQYMRLSSIYEYLDIPQLNPIGETVYNAPLRFFIYKKKIVLSEEQMINRKRKKFKKYISQIKKNFSVDRFYRENYQNLFNAIDVIIN